MSSTFSADEQRSLLEVARASIDNGLKVRHPLTVDVERYPRSLRVSRASFVTLRIAGRLRGCMGSLLAKEPLVADVAYNAFSAAFRDSRFAPLSPGELTHLQVHISILSSPEPVAFESESHLLSLMRPGIDGFTMHEGSRRGTLLPSVWERIADPREFLAHLKRKAGLPADYWSATVRVERYTTESIGQE